MLGAHDAARYDLGPHETKGREMRSRSSVFAVLACLLLVAAALTATVGNAAQSRASSSKLTFCSDISYPPEEAYKGTTPVGSDIDIGTDVAKQLGRKAAFKNTVFDSIIPALLTKHCDAIISGMNDTAERRKSVDFVDYLSVGQAITVKKGNPEHFSTLASLSGKRVSVESGTTNRGFLVSTSKKLVSQGKKAITIVTFPKDTDAFTALLAGRVDAYYADAPPAAYYAKQNPTKVQVCCHPINPFPIGIAIRKHDPLKAALQKGIAMLYANGS